MADETRNRDNNFNTVINLSVRVLSKHEISILSKGLKFVPTPTSVNRTELITDIKQWGRRMRLKEYFADSDNTNTEPSDDTETVKMDPKPWQRPSLRLLHKWSGTCNPSTCFQ